MFPVFEDDHRLEHMQVKELAESVQTYRVTANYTKNLDRLMPPGLPVAGLFPSQRVICLFQPNLSGHPSVQEEEIQPCLLGLAVNLGKYVGQLRASLPFLLI